MSLAYDEILEGLHTQRQPPGQRHELVCDRLHTAVAASVAKNPTARLLARRTQIVVSRDATLRPDLALVTAATGKLWLAAEIVNAGDHHPDTVIKKALYEELRIPRLWMIDPRYDNVEVYHATQFGLMLKGILAGQELLTESLLPEFQVPIAELFRA
jgi:Uma2 family endonuclease